MKVEYLFEVEARPKACEAEVVATSREDTTYVYMPRLGDLSRAVAAVFPPEDVALDAIIHEIYELFSLQVTGRPNKKLVDRLYRDWRDRYWEKRKMNHARKN